MEQFRLGIDPIENLVHKEGRKNEKRETRREAREERGHTKLFAIGTARWNWILQERVCPVRASQRGMIAYLSSLLNFLVSSLFLYSPRLFNFDSEGEDRP